MGYAFKGWAVSLTVLFSLCAVTVAVKPLEQRGRSLELVAKHAAVVGNAFACADLSSGN